MATNTTDLADQATQAATLASPPAGKTWLTYGDAMRVLGVLAVIVVHTCDMILFETPARSVQWWAANFLDAGGRWAVPVFIMLSGALLLSPSRQESAGEFYRRRLSRLGIAVAFWSAFFILFGIYYTTWVHWPDVPRQLLAGEPYMHLHFVFRLAGLYLITPLLRVYVRNAPWKLRAGMALAILAGAMANSLIAAALQTKLNAVMIMWPFLGFYLAGNVLRDIQVTPRLLAGSCVVFVLSWAAMACGTGLICTPGGKPAFYPSWDMALYDFLSVPRVAMSFSAWFILAYVFGRISIQAPIQRFFKVLAPLTLGIYLVHPLFRELLWTATDKFGLSFSVYFWPSIWLGPILMMLVIAVCSVALTAVISAVPGLRRIVG